MSKEISPFLAGPASEPVMAKPASVDGEKPAADGTGMEEKPIEMASADKGPAVDVASNGIRIKNGSLTDLRDGLRVHEEPKNVEPPRENPSEGKGGGEVETRETQDVTKMRERAEEIVTEFLEGEILRQLPVVLGDNQRLRLLGLVMERRGREVVEKFTARMAKAKDYTRTGLLKKDKDGALKEAVESVIRESFPDTEKKKKKISGARDTVDIVARKLIIEKLGEGGSSLVETDNLVEKVLQDGEIAALIEDQERKKIRGLNAEEKNLLKEAIGRVMPEKTLTEEEFLEKYQAFLGEWVSKETGARYEVGKYDANSGLVSIFQKNEDNQEETNPSLRPHELEGWAKEFKRPGEQEEVRIIDEKEIAKSRKKLIEGVSAMVKWEMLEKGVISAIKEIKGGDKKRKTRKVLSLSKPDRDRKREITEGVMKSSEMESMIVVALDDEARSEWNDGEKEMIRMIISSQIEAFIAKHAAENAEVAEATEAADGDRKEEDPSTLEEWENEIRNTLSPFDKDFSEETGEMYERLKSVREDKELTEEQKIEELKELKSLADYEAERFILAREASGVLGAGERGVEGEEKREDRGEKREDSNIERTIEEESEEFTPVEGIFMPEDSPRNGSLEILEAILEDSADGLDEGEKSAMEKLEDNLREARYSYASLDYREGTLLKRVFRFFGKKGENIRGESDALNNERQRYESALTLYKNACLEGLKKNKDLDQKQARDKMAHLIKIFNFEEPMALYEARMAAREKSAENDEIYKKWQQVKNWYLKLPLKKKLIFSGILLAGSALSFQAGAVTAAAAFIAARRSVTGLGTAVASEGLMEKGAGAYRQSRSNHEVNRTVFHKMENTEWENPEEKFDWLSARLDKKIQEVDQKFQRRKWGSFFRKSTAVLAGVAIGAGGWISEKMGWTGDADSAGAGRGTTGVTPPPEPATPPSPDSPKPAGGISPSTSTGPTIESLADAEPGVPAPEVALPTNYVEVAGKGDSVWKMIERNLENNPKYKEVFSGLDEAHKTHIIDAIKDKVAENPAAFGLENIDTLDVGQEINFSEIMGDGDKMEGFFEEAGKLTDQEGENIVGNNETLRQWREDNPGERITSEKVEEILAERSGGSEIGTAPDGGVESERMEQGEGDMWKHLDEQNHEREKLNDMRAGLESEKLVKEAGEIAEREEIDSSVTDRDSGGYDEKILQIGNGPGIRIEELPKLPESLVLSGSMESTAGSLMKHLSFEKKEVWDSLKKMTFGEIMKSEDIDPRIKDRIGAVVKLAKESLGSEVESDIRETLWHWVEKATKKGFEAYNQA